MKENRLLLVLVKWIMPAIIIILICLIAFLKPTPKAPGTIEGVVTFKPTCPNTVCIMSNTEIIIYRFGGKVIVTKTTPDNTGRYTLTLPPATYILDVRLENATSTDTPREIRLQSNKTEVLNIQLGKTN
jgi:hypothetical protein